MTISINAIEAYWIGLNLVTFFVTVAALVDFRRDLVAVRQLNGHIRGIIARGNVRRAWFMVGLQALLLGVAAPGLFTAREATMTIGLFLFLFVPPLLLAIPLMDRRDRQRIAKRLIADIESARMAQLGRLEALAQETKDVTTDTNERVIELQDRS